MLHSFTTPTSVGPARGDIDSTDPAERLFAHYPSIPTGVTVWKDDDGNWQEGEYPYAGGAEYPTYDNGVLVAVNSAKGLADAELVFSGGRVHWVTEDVVAELIAAGYGNRINIAPISDRFSINDMPIDLAYEKHRASHIADQDQRFIITDSMGTGVNIGPGSSLSVNERDVFIRAGTQGWVNSTTSGIWAPPFFGGGFLPQHGWLFRFRNVGGRNQFILVWHDVAFSSPIAINIGVFNCADDGSNMLFRSQGFHSGLGPLLTNVFPYVAEARVRDEFCSVRVYFPNTNTDKIPEWDDPNFAFTVDLTSFGDTSTIPTPLDGGESGVWIGHVGTHPNSKVRYPFVNYERQDS